MKYFQNVQLKHGYSLIPPLGEYSKRLDNEYKDKKLLFKILVVIDKILRSNKFILLISLIAITPVCHLWESTSPIDGDSGIFIIAEKRTLFP